MPKRQELLRGLREEEKERATPYCPSLLELSDEAQFDAGSVLSYAKPSRWASRLIMTSPQRKLLNFFLVALGLLLVAFLLNAALVTVGFVRLAMMRPEQLQLEQIVVNDLDSPQGGTVALSLGLHLGLLERMVAVSLKGTSTVRVMLQGDQLLTVQIPPCSLGTQGGSHESLNLTGIRFRLPTPPPPKLIETLQAAYAQGRIEVGIEVALKVETLSYWFPIVLPLSFSQRRVLELPRGGNQKINHGEWGLEAIEFPEAQRGGSQSLRCQATLRYPAHLVPPFLSVWLPSLYFSLARPHGSDGWSEFGAVELDKTYSID